jgi:uncharacterized low-complexity protein
MRLSSLVILPVLALAVSAPAMAEVSVTKGKQLCKAAALAQTPAPSRVTFKDGSDAMRASSDAYFFALRVRNADGSKGEATCVVDRAAESAKIEPVQVATAQ